MVGVVARKLLVRLDFFLAAAEVGVAAVAHVAAAAEGLFAKGGAVVFEAGVDAVDKFDFLGVACAADGGAHALAVGRVKLDAQRRSGAQGDVLLL